MTRLERLIAVGAGLAGIVGLPFAMGILSFGSGEVVTKEASKPLSLTVDVRPQDKPANLDLVPMPQPSPSEVPRDAEESESLAPGHYRGSYFCRQGETPLDLEVMPAEDGVQFANYNFGGEGTPQGSYKAAINRTSTGRFDVVPVRWLQKPSGYYMITATVELKGKLLVGTFPGHKECKDLTAVRD